MRVLVTGGTGYIGSHTAVELVAAGHDVVLLDNLENSSELVADRIGKIAGRSVEFTRADLRDEASLEAAIGSEQFEAVIHFAGKKAVGESVEDPLGYYEANVGGTLNLCRVLQRHGVRRFVFSSSATVYGDQDIVPVTETAYVAPFNPYGNTKLTIERILTDLHGSDDTWSVALLRYFNPVGAHSSGTIGEDPRGIPNNLMPYITQVAIGRRSHLTIFGDDYPTRDGTGIRDYVHVTDLATGHVAALDHVAGTTGVDVFNLGTGRGTSVKELVTAFEEATGVEIPTEVGPRRAGDVAELWCDPSKAAEVLGWRAELDVADMCRDSWRWQFDNPEGFGS